MSLFPILQSHEERKAHTDGKNFGIPWEVVKPHAEQAMRNHYQTLERLAERGGLSWSEMAAVLEDRPWSQMSASEAIQHVLHLVTQAKFPRPNDIVTS